MRKILPKNKIEEIAAVAGDPNADSYQLQKMREEVCALCDSHEALREELERQEMDEAVFKAVCRTEAKRDGKEFLKCDKCGRDIVDPENGIVLVGEIRSAHFEPNDRHIILGGADDGRIEIWAEDKAEDEEVWEKFEVNFYQPDPPHKGVELEDDREIYINVEKNYYHKKCFAEVI